MTLDELLEMARQYDAGCRATGHENTIVGELARGVLDLLSEAQPCGWDAPTIDRGLNPVGILLPYQWATTALSPIAAISPTDARHMARMLLRAADAADKETT